MIWVSIAGIKDGLASEKPLLWLLAFLETLPITDFTLTGLIIGTVTGMAATSGKLVAGYFPKTDLPPELILVRCVWHNMFKYNDGDTQDQL